MRCFVSRMLEAESMRAHTVSMRVNHSVLRVVMFTEERDEPSGSESVLHSD